MNYRDRLKERIKEAQGIYYGLELFAVSDDELLNKYGKERYLYLAGKLRGLEIAQKLLEEQDELQR